MSETLDTKIKKNGLVNKSNISSLSKNSDLNITLEKLAAKAELKAEKDKILKLQTHYSSYFFRKHFFDDDGF